MANNFSYIPDDAILDYQVGDKIIHLTKQQFIEMLETNGYAISSNGVVYDQKKRGVVPAILDKWYSDRLEFQALMKKFEDEGDKVKGSFYKKRQHVQKILLNSLYGVLGLPVFRFYDIDNAEATTLSGQDIIKTTEKYIHSEFNKIIKTLGGTPREKEDNVIYCDTDSAYMSADILFELEGITNDEERKKRTIQYAIEFQDKVNLFYNVLTKHFFNVDKHFIKIAADVIARRALWVAKKNYAMMKVYNMETMKSINPPKLDVKGISSVRSSFPESFGKFLEEIMISILTDVSKEKINKRILEFIDNISKVPTEEIANSSAVKEIEKWIKVKGGRKPFGSLNKLLNSAGGTLGAGAHVKSAIHYNDFIDYYKIEGQFEKIREGEKCKWVYLKNNPFKLETIGFKGYEDPPQVLDFIDKYIDKHKIFEKALTNKLQSFYQAVKWEYPNPNDENINAFFEF